MSGAKNIYKCLVGYICYVSFKGRHGIVFSSKGSVSIKPAIIVLKYDSWFFDQESGRIIFIQWLGSIGNVLIPTLEDENI